jgi:nucleoside-diphosphate-sugar epimerase
MRVLLTGATGFVGSHVARVLLAQGHEVHAPVRPSSQRARIADIERDLRLIAHDLLVDEPAALASHKPELCIHAAWYAEPGRYLSAPVNVDFMAASARLALTLAEAGCRRFIGVGTCFEYDVSHGRLTETTPTRPRHLYSAAKLSVALLLEQIAASTGMSYAWARLFYLYGPHEHPRRLVPAVTTALLRGEEAPVTPGEQVRDFLHVEDVGAAICAIAGADLTGPVNVGSGVETTVKELVGVIEDLIGTCGLVRLGARPYAEGEPMRIVAANESLRACGWTPRYDLRTGLSATVDWWRQQIDAARPPDPRPVSAP